MSKNCFAILIYDLQSGKEEEAEAETALTTPDVEAAEEKKERKPMVTIKTEPELLQPPSRVSTVSQARVHAAWLQFRAI